MLKFGSASKYVFNFVDGISNDLFGSDLFNFGITIASTSTLKLLEYLGFKDISNLCFATTCDVEIPGIIL